MYYFLVCFMLIVSSVIGTELFPQPFPNEEDFLLLRRNALQYCRREGNTEVNVAHCNGLNALPYNMTHFVRIPLIDDQYFVDGKLKIVRIGKDVYHFFGVNDDSKISSFYKTLYESL